MKTLEELLEHTNNQKEAIKIYLDYQKEKDNQLKEALTKEDKNLNDCLKYITEKARKELNSQNGFIHSSKVFSWAIHYFTESNEELKKENIGFNSKTKEKVEVKKQKVEQPSLFDL